MISSITSALSCVIILINVLVLCTSELPQPPSLTLYSPGEVEYTDVIVKRVEDNLTLVCELKGDTPKVIVWNYVAVNESGENRPFTTEPIGPSTQVSTLTKTNLQLSDSGHYMCSSPPFSQKKYILVQNRGPHQCARGAFWCGARCVLASYVCDGREDCRQGEDEAPALCGQRPCLRADKLNCSTGRCVPSAACCRSASLCRQPACCDEHPRYSRREDFNVEFPPLFEDRHAPDDYGFIQSTIYTVTACALIFMIAVVLLVSAICKMHMKRRSYGAADRVARQHYNMHYAQTHRFPPCYEESRLLSELPRVTPTVSAHNSPIRVPSECATDNQASTADDQNNGFGLTRLSAIFNSRYRQVPTQCCDVEMSDVRTTSLQNSPTRNRTLDPYRSPTYCDMNPDLFFSNPDTSNCGRDLNYMATPIEVYRRRTLRNHLDRVIDNIERQRPLTLQLGRFQLSIPRFSRRSSNDRRPDTPNVAEINIDDLDFVRLNGNDTYTLNGRTIRLLGASFENYPGINLNEGGRPPPYNEAMRYKLYGPPPEYLSRDGLNDDNNVVTVNVDDIARNVELPPNYDELNDETVNNNGDEAAGGDLNANNVINIDVAAANNDDDTVNREAATTNNSLNNEIASADNNLNADIATANNSLNNDVATINNTLNNDVATANSTVDSSENNAALFTSVLNDVTSNVIHSTNNNIESNNGNSDVAETISSVIDNLPAIDSDVNAN